MFKNITKMKTHPYLCNYFRCRNFCMDSDISDSGWTFHTHDITRVKITTEQKRHVPYFSRIHSGTTIITIWGLCRKI